jgi:hypothetical protein
VSTDGLLALAAAVIAVLTLLSSEAREDLRLRFTWPLRIIGLLSFLVLVAIKLSPVWGALGLPMLGPWRWGFDPEIASFVTITCAVMILIFRIVMFRLNPTRIEEFSRLSERLLFAGKYAELLFLLEKHFAGLQWLVEGRHVASRLRRWLRPDTLSVFINDRRIGGTETLEEWTRQQRQLKSRTRAWLADRLPDHDERQRRARRLQERVFLSETFVDYLSKARPDFALKVLDLKVPFFTEAFLHLLISAWLKNPHSVLYEETAQNQGMRKDNRYEFTPLNPVLWHLFGDPFRADDLAIYKPVGDFVTDELARLRRAPEDDAHRKPQPNFSDDGKWRSPVHLGLRLFDYWISESLHRGSHWHGWLMYWEDCVDLILGNMAALERVDHTREFPTPYHYLLYEIFATIGNWIEAAARIDQNLESVQIDHIDMMHDTIAKSAVISFGHCLRAVLESPNVTIGFKAYILHMVLHRYEHVAEREDLRKLYEMAVLKGGGKYGDIEEYYFAMRQTLPAVDRNRLYLEPANDLYELILRTVG